MLNKYLRRMILRYSNAGSAVKRKTISSDSTLNATDEYYDVRYNLTNLKESVI